MTIRYHITLGARTTAGGIVTTALPFFSIDDVPVAHEGDKVTCPACKSVGVIKANGPRLPETTMGRKVALSGDLCICGCTPPPRMVHSQTRCYQELAGNWSAELDPIDSELAPPATVEPDPPADAAVPAPVAAPVPVPEPPQGPGHTPNWHVDSDTLLR